MFGFDPIDRLPLISGALAPSRTESTYSNDTPLVSLLKAKQYLGLYSGSGMATEDTSVDGVLEDLIGWATERIALYNGQDVLLSGITDYYPALAARLALSSAPELTDEQPLTLDYLAEGETAWTSIEGATLDDTALPPVLMVPDGVRNPSTRHANPVRVEYTTHPFSNKGRDLVSGTVLSLVQLRWQSRGEPASAVSEGAVRRILGANLS